MFNVIQVDEIRGILEKTSRNKRKLIAEINWYLKLPDSLQYLLPHIYEYSQDAENPYVRMEYYGYRTLHDLMLGDELSDRNWREIFKHLRFYVEDMQRYKLPSEPDKIQTAVRAMYVDKTINRLETIRSRNEFRHFFDQPIVVNGLEHRSIDKIIELLPSLVGVFLVPDSSNNFSIIHGDLCLPNILIEETYKFMRLIDPRGSFGAFDIYGDSRYDLAKLFHSMEGRYDYIVSDRFTASAIDNRIDYSVDGNCERIWAIFNEVFAPLLDGKQSAIRLIEATLFLSMIPLHSDAPERQFAMLATGVELFDSVLGGGFLK